MLRRIEKESAAEAARFLDGSTMVLRWLVAFLRHLAELPEEAEARWGLWMQAGGRSGEAGPRAVLAHDFHTGICYAAAAAGLEAGELEGLLAEELLPERLVADRTALELWERASGPGLGRARSREALSVLVLPPGGRATARSPLEGFRAAVEADAPRLGELEGLFAREMAEDDPRTEFAPLILRSLVYVVEEAGEAVGIIRSNLSDGRYVHLGGLYVLPDRRGRGIGARLLAGAAEAVHREGAAALIDTRRDNLPSLGAARAAGYREAGEGVVLRFGEDAWRRPG